MSIADKLTYLDTTKQLLKTEINKVKNVLDDNSTFRSYPQELFNGYLDILNNGTDTLWSNLEKVSQIGTEAVLENVENAPMKIELSGNTSQDGTPTPDSPVEVKVVKGENVVSISGENQSDKTDYPINLGDIELCKINTYKDYFHKDSGKWYKHKEIGKVVLDGTTNSFVWKHSALSSDTKGLYQAIIEGKLIETVNGNTENGKSNYFKLVSGTAKEAFDNNSNGMWFEAGNYAIYVILEKTSLADANNWLSTHNTILYYVLATPTEEEITNTTLIEQLETISKAKSIKDKTYITQTNDELPFVLDVEAIKGYNVD